MSVDLPSMKAFFVPVLEVMREAGEPLKRREVAIRAPKARGVGRPEIQAFFGALSGNRESKGVFLTTSYYTDGAREFAQMVSGSLVLVDGQELAHLMIDYGVGVERRAVYLPSVNRDYFDEE